MGSSDDTRPAYDVFRGSMGKSRGPLAEKLALQALATTAPFRSLADTELTVLDIGCGYGHTALELAKRCRRVVGIEPSAPIAQEARQLAEASGRDNLEMRLQGVETLEDEGAYDLVLLDNVLEHVPDGRDCLARISRSLKPGGVLYLVVPNKLWPIEPHYFLPFLSYLPLPLANRYLRWTGRGSDYTDASYAPTYWRLNRWLWERPELTARYTPPANLDWTMAGSSLTYRVGVRALKHFPFLWAFSKAFLVVAVKGSGKS